MKKKIIFKGAATALVTPYKDGRIDYDALGKLIDTQCDAGISALVIGGTTGEAATLSDDERYRLFEFSHERCLGRCPLIFGTGTNDTRVAVRHTERAQRIGCEGLLLVTPYYNKGTEEGIFRHYLTIANSTDLPIILYNVPSRTGVNLGFNLLAKLSEIENIVALKEAGDSCDRLVGLSALSDKLTIYAGNDSQIYPTLALGGAGVISVVSNIFPALVGKICTDYFEGRQMESLSAQIAILPLVRALFLETNPAPLKYAMSFLGLCRGELRLPLSVVRESTKAAIEAALDSIEAE